MKQAYTKRLLAFVLTLAMVLTGSSVSGLLGGVAAEAASKKVTLKLNKSKVSLKEGKTTTLKITKKNVKKIKSQKWSSSKKAVATVSKKGKVTAKKAGKTTIKVVVKYLVKGSKKAKSKTLKCTVTVAAKTVQSTTAPTSTAAPTVAPTVEPTTAPTETPLRMPHDDATNLIDSTPITTTVPGGSIEITIKDNGVMRTDITAKELASTAMGTGINLGNTLEATVGLPSKQYVINGTDETEYDKAWGQPTVTQEYFDALHSYGINTVRIPVGWSNGDSDDGTYQIDEKLLARVEEVANYALNNGMYVVINDHWDNGWWGQFGACKRDEDGKKVPDEEFRTAAWERYETYWTQIAERFKDYSDHVILEGANEELGPGFTKAINPETGYSDASNTITGSMTIAERYELTNAINQKFVDIVRGTGGNNRNRFLLIPGYDTNIDLTADTRFIMPTDIEENGKDRLFVSVHYYTPWDFCGDGGNGSYTEEDREAVPGYFAPLQRFVDEGYATIVGECGVCSPQTVDGDVPQSFADTFTECRKYYAVPCLWETGQYFNRAEATLKFKDVALFFNEVNEANGDTSMTMNTGLTKERDDIVSVDGKEPVWSWTGMWYKNGGDYKVGEDRLQGGGTVGNSAEDFVPKSEVTRTIADDATEITFDATGYQAFIKLDLSKYKNPAIRFTFTEDSLDEYEDGNYVGNVQLGANSEAKFTEDIAIGYDFFADKAIILQKNLRLSQDKPYLTIAFSNKPNVTGMYIYDLGE